MPATLYIQVQGHTFKDTARLQKPSVFHKLQRTGKPSLRKRCSSEIDISRKKGKTMSSTKRKSKKIQRTWREKRSSGILSFTMRSEFYSISSKLKTKSPLSSKRTSMLVFRSSSAEVIAPFSKPSVRVLAPGRLPGLYSSVKSPQ